MEKIMSSTSDPYNIYISNKTTAYPTIMYSNKILGTESYGIPTKYEYKAALDALLLSIQQLLKDPDNDDLYNELLQQVRYAQNVLIDEDPKNKDKR